MFIPTKSGAEAYRMMYNITRVINLMFLKSMSNYLSNVLKLKYYSYKLIATVVLIEKMQSLPSAIHGIKYKPHKFLLRT